jgi:asparagine synthase (glutamine-hydrolysing)
MRGAACHRRPDVVIGTADASLIARRGLRDPRGAILAARIQQRHLTYLDTSALLDLRDRAREADDSGRRGAFIEAGCALGGSAIILAASKSAARPLLVFDVFGMIPPPSERDGSDVRERYAEIMAGTSRGIGDDPYYGYDPGLLSTVEDNFRSFGIDLARSHVQLVQGLFEQTLHPEGPVALAHIDGDWYDSVAVCLRQIWPVLSVGGVIVVDDYDDWSGCRHAVDDFLRATPGACTERRSRLHLVKEPGRP